MTPEESIAREERIETLTRRFIEVTRDPADFGCFEIAEAFGRAAKHMAIAMAHVSKEDEPSVINHIQGYITRGFTVPVDD